MKALIHNNKVVDISETTFEVHEDLIWVDADDTVKTGWKYIDGVFKQPEQPKLSYVDLRIFEYPQLSEFVDAYYWMQEGDDTKMDEYLDKVKAVKQKYPKVTDAN